MPADQPLVLVLHGARGDLARRMVLPAMALLAHRGLLPEKFALVGVGRQAQEDEAFRDLIRSAVEEFGDDDAKAGAKVLAEAARWCRDVGQGDHPEGDPDPGEVPATIAAARAELAGHDDPSGDEVATVHYLAVPPSAFAPITRSLGRHDLAGPGVRVVYEKPYGTSPESFRELDATVHEVLDEDQVFRIDHFLGKEATQTLHVLRFANELFGGVWHRDHVAQVQVDVPETLDVADRAEFYDATGAALDMLVTHLFQVAATVAMEPPAGMAADQLAEAREAVMAAFRPLDPASDVVLGQFDGYQDLDDVADGSTTDTYVAARLWVDTDRWHGVPFVLRTGKRLGVSAQQVTLVLRTPHHLFGEDVGPNRITVQLSGAGALEVTTTVKRPGPDLRLASGTAALDLGDVAGGGSLPPYAGLLLDVLEGDRTMFTTTAGLEQAWRAFAPLLGDARPAPLPYAPGSMGPQDADALTDGIGWAVQPEG